ncbi:type II secretion system protein [Luteolibacter yonseiensis]|uniref:Type II secretion system protein n=1 Tax=Luteolibacter yonseiensis TaxID=1144680 RepID=A0A934V5Z9_9BACT|nr:type II secretion system protein [Luteolibacter yonseiensis]MBK1814492.1 type II secretion system protein [Luteolibacter yonseiensis]
MKHRSPGFTLVELLVTITVTISLAALGMLGYRSAKEKAKSIVEINAARNLITGYLGYAADHSSQVMPGFKADPDAMNLKGELMAFPMNARYPYRLMANVPAIDGIIFYNGNEGLLHKENNDYEISLRPNLGINAELVGGNFGSASALLNAAQTRLVSVYGKYYLSHLSEADDPSKLIVFASSRYTKDEPGYFEIKPPNMTANVWSSDKFEKEGTASKHGYVDFRWSGKAVCAMLGGNVELLDEEQMRDMRRWSIQACRANDEDFRISRQ